MEHEERQEIQSQVDSPNKSNLKPLIVRVLVIVLLIVVCIGIYFEQSSQPNQKESSLKGDLQKLGLLIMNFIACGNILRQVWMSLSILWTTHRHLLSRQASFPPIRFQLL